MSKFQEQVNEVVSKMVQGDDGKWVIPDDVAEDLSEEIKFAVTAERRYRDTQSAFTKSQQELKKTMAVAEALENRIMNSEVALTKEQKFELNELKKSDPEKWRAKLNEYEEAGKKSLSSELEKIRKESSNKGELAVREEQMAAWSESTGIELTQEIVDNDLPPRFLKDLEAGKCTFEEFLDNAGNFLTKTKVVAGSEDNEPNEPNLSDAAGGNEPSKKAQEGDFEQSYKDVVF